MRSVDLFLISFALYGRGETFNRRTLPRFFGTTHLALVTLLGTSLSCKPDDGPLPTSPSAAHSNTGLAVAAHISAPQPLTPADGTDLNESQPTLTVANATITDDTAVTYRFDVATDTDFSTIVANVERIPQGQDQTSWRISPALGNARYCWRARAENDRGVAGPYSAPASFTVTGAGGLVFDSLMNGTTVGEVRGGNFVSQGWQVTSKSDFIRYAVPTITSGFVEWENTGLQTTNPAPDNVMLIGMWDASTEAGPYRTNAFRVHLRKLDDTQEPPFLRLRWIANGEQHDIGANIQFWDPGRVYRWRMEWGSGPLGNAVQIFLDDVPIILQQYTRDYTPKRHWIELGVEERHESVVGAVYSNVRIGRR